MQIFQGMCDWFVAEDIDDTLRVMAEVYGGEATDYEDERDTFSELPDDQLLSIHWDETDIDWVKEHEILPEGHTIELSHGFVKVTATVGNWIAANGRGFLCSTEY